MNLKFSWGRKCLSVLMLVMLSFVAFQANAQDCTVNAGVPESICPGQAMVLKGKFTGLFTSSAVWSQVGGPAVTIGTPVVSGSDITANVTGFAPGNTYTFRITARCQDGSQVFQDVVFTTLVATKATVGSNITSCPGTITLSGSTPGVNETGNWSITSRAYGMAFSGTSTNPAAKVVLPKDSTASATFRWTIMNTNGCASTASMTVTDIGGDPNVSAGSNQTLSNCYNLTQSTNLFASYGGNGFMGQQGTWSFISGPSTPTFSDINNNRSSVSNLVTGTYRLRWTVVGPCASNYSEMTITVPAPTQDVTDASGGELIYCDGRTVTVINARAPGYTNETATWSYISGPGAAPSISDIHAPSITVSGLTASGSTRLRYTINNSVTGCTSIGDYLITYSAGTSILATTGPVIVLPSTATAISVPYTYTGGNQTYWQLVTAPTGATIAASGTTGYQFINASPIDFTGLDKIGTYYFRLLRTTANAGQGGCANAFNDFSVVISQPPTAANAGTAGSGACNVLTSTLAGNVPTVGTGYWSQVSGPSTVVFDDIYDAGTGISNLAAGSYVFRWIVTGGYGGTDAQSDVTKVIAGLTVTTANAGTNMVVCNQTPIKLSANTPLNSEIGTWSITPVAGTFVNIHDPNTKITGLADNTTYTLSWNISNACNSSSTSTITVTTSNTAGPKQAVAGSAQCLSSTVTTFNLAGNDPTGTETGTWAFVSGPNTPSITSPNSAATTVTGVVNGTYKFEWSLNTTSCTATRDTVTITAIAAATTATVTVTPVNLCNVSVITLAGNTPVIGTGYWTQVGGAGGAVITNPYSPTTTVTGLTTNSYTFRWTITNGACSSNFADVKYNISAPPATPTVGADQELCGITTTTLTGNVINPGQGLWKVVSGPNTPTFSSFTSPTATLSGLVTGVYQLVWTSSNGAFCGISESRTLNITMRENATAAATTTGLCNASVAQLTGNNGSSGTWTFVSGSSIPTITTNSAFTAIAYSLTNGTYVFKYTIPASGGCVVTSSATVSVTVSASPSAAQAGIDQVLCNAASTVLAADVPSIGTGTWTFIAQPAGSAAGFTNSHSPTTSLTSMIPGVYLLQWNVTNGNCGTNQDIVRITTSAPPTTAVAGAAQLTACSGSVTIIANTPSVGVGTWSQVSGLTATIDAPNSPVSAVLGTTPGAYSFKWTISNGSCAASSSTVTINVTSTPPTPASAGPDQSICNVGTTATATLAGNSPVGGESGVWSVASKPGGASPSFGNSTQYNTSVSNLIAGTYQFTWTVSNGSCVSSSSVTITVTDKPTPSFAGLDQTICLYTPVTLHATAVTTGIGTWSVTSQPISTPVVVFGNENSPTTDVNGLTSGDYTFTWITTNGNVCATSMSNTTVHIVAPPTPAQAGSYQTVCLGVNPILTANSPTSGIGAWSVITSAGGTPAFSTVNSNNATVTGLVAGVYTFSWTITNGGCTSTDRTQITVQPAISNNAIATAQTICSGGTPVAMTGTSPAGGNGTTYTYQWQQSTTSDIAGFADINGATSSTYAPGSLTSTTWYRRLVASGACTPGTFSNTLQIFVQPPISLNTLTAPLTTTFCQTGDPGVIIGITPTGGDMSTYNYQWQQSTTSAVAGFVNITGVAATARDFGPGNLTTTTWFRRIVTSGNCNSTSTALTITINPYSTLASSQAITSICSGTTFSYSPVGSIAGTTFTWTRPGVSNINSGASSSGSGSFSQVLTNTDVVPLTVQYLYSLTVTGCTNPIAYSITVNVNPTPSVTLPSNQIVCNGSLTSAVVFTGSSVANTIYSWVNNTPAIGLVAASSGTINAFAISNTTNSPITASITVTPISNTCSGVSQTFTIVANPTPLISAIAQSVCSGLTFTVTPTYPTNGRVPSGTTYSWGLPTGSGISGGMTGSGASNISGNITQPFNVSRSVTYIVTPNTTSCGDGPTFTVTITVNPVAAINPLTTVSCAGVMFYYTPTTTDGTVPASTTYAWAAPTVSGLSAGASGSGLASIRGSLTNTSSSAGTATYNVVPTSGTCTGMTFVLTVSILPKAIMNAQMTATTCSGVAFDFTPVDVFSGNILPSGTTFTWATPVSTGLTGGAAQLSATNHIFGIFDNTTNIARTATYSIIPLSGTCVGNTYAITVTVNPIVNIASTTPQFVRTICSGTTFTLSPANITNGIVPVTTLYRWSTPAMTGGLLGGTASSNVASITGTLNNPGTTAETATYIVTPSTSCGDGASFTVVIQVNPLAVISPMSTTICGGSPFTVVPSNGTDGVIPTPTTYAWLALPTGSGFSGGVTRTGQSSVNGTLVNTVNSFRTATYLVTPTSAGCNGPVFSVTININPTAYINALTNVICNGSSFTTTPVNITAGIVPASTTYTWLAPTGTGFTGGVTGAGSSITGTLANSSSIAHSATYIVTPTSGACQGGNFTVTVTVNPIAAVTDMTATTCSGVAFTVTPTDNINGTIPANTTYTWNAPSSAGITGGIAESTGAVNINGLLTNTTTTAAVIVYTVTPTSNQCTGAQFSVTVTINPSAAITPMSTTICGGSPFTVLPTNSTNGRVPPSTTYTWLALPTGIGFTNGVTATAAANISGTLVNTTNIQRTATYLVTPSTGTANCTGAQFSVTVYLNPLAIVNQITGTTCSGATFTISPVNGANGIVPAGITYTWGTPSVTGGITGGGAGTALTFISGTLVNPTNTVQTATYIVTPNTTLCGDGASFTVTITVNPKATVQDMTGTTCAGVGFTVSPTNGNGNIIPAGTIYSWVAPTGTGFSGGLSGTGTMITGTLVNTAAAITTATYTITTLSGNCAGTTFSLVMTINPKAIVNPLSFTTCSGSLFSATPTNGMNGSIIPSGTTYVWPMATGTSLSGLASGTGADITATLINSSNIARTATYILTPTSATGNCGGSSFTVTIYVNPLVNVTPMSTTTCSGVAFAVSPSNGANGIVPSGTTYTWSAPVNPNITGLAGGSSLTFISGTISNSTNTAQSVTYTITPSTTACGNGAVFTVVVTVNPIATITTITTTTCSGVGFSLSPVNGANGTILPTGTTYQWFSVPTVTGGVTGGLSRATASTTIFGTLTNPTNITQTATYTVTPTSGTCTGALFSVVVTINPGASITAMAVSVCSGTAFSVSPTQGANGTVPAATTYAWLVPTGTSISNGISETGQTDIHGTLTNTSNISRTATYIVTPTTNTGCTGATFTVTVTVDPRPSVPVFSGVPGCTGTISFTPTGTLIPLNTTYTWPSPTGGGYSGGQAQLTPSTNFHATIASLTNVAVTPTYLVTPTSGACTGSPFTVTINLGPNAIVSSPISITTCSGVLFSISPVDGTNGVVPAGTTFTWNLMPTGTGFAGAITASGSSDIHGTLSNTQNTAVSAVYTVTPVTGSCAGAQFSVVVTVNPAAYIVAMSTVVCNGVTFSVTPTNGTNGIVPSGTTYTWSAPSVTGTLTGGAGGSGATTISGNLSHTNSTAQTATYIVVPTSVNCGAGSSFTVTVTVQPMALINAMSVTTCNGVGFNVTPLSGTNGVVPTGTTYTWLAPTGTGFSGSVSQITPVSAITGTLVNNTSSAVQASYVVTPQTSGCTGPSFGLTVTLNPGALITAMTTTICSGSPFIVTPADNTNGRVPSGTTYTWGLPTGTGIANDATGTGSSITGTLTNSTNISRTATYIVSTTSGTCAGTTFTVTVTVDPKASINAITTITASGAVFTISPAQTINGTVPAGTTYDWSSPAVTGGMTGGASGSGASFISGSLVNTTNIAQTATYIVTPTSGNCTGATFTIVVTVSPLASINALTVTTCSGVAFGITPVDGTNGNVPAGTTYTWSVPTGTGFTGGASATNRTSITGNLVNTTSAPVTATYTVIPSSAGYAGASFTVTVTVNPAPVLNSTLTPADICSGTLFSYAATSATSGAVLTWSRTTVTGITTGGAATGTGDISQTLSNSTTSPLSINYVYTLSANGCTNTNASTVTIIVNPIPVLSSSLTPPDVYNATLFNYTITSLTPGTTFTWSRAPIAAINANVSGAGVGALISETLTTTNPTLTSVVYAITLTANGCVNAQTITVNVSPTPGLSSSLTPGAICSGTVFGYTATSATPSTTFTWFRAALTAINGNTTGSGSNATINETLINNSNIPVNVVYTVMLTANSFTSTQNVTVVVNPTPDVNAIADGFACNNTLLTPATFTSLVAGTTYAWTNTNTAIGLASAGSGTINGFTATNSGTATITALVTVTPISNTCVGSARSFSLTVYPTPVLSSTLSPTGICNGASFSYTATTATAGTAFSWSRIVPSGLTPGGSGTGSGNISGQTFTNSTTAPLTVQYVYTLTANACPNTQTVSVPVNPTAVLSSVLSPTSIFGGTLFTYSPTSATPSVVFTWARGTLTGISNTAGSGTGVINETLINTTASPIAVTYTYTLTVGGCANSQAFTLTVIPSNIDAVDDNFSGVCVNGATGGTTASVLANDVLNSTTVDASQVNMSIISDGGITGIAFNALGQLTVPARTFEGTYTVTYRICVSANPTNCDQATVVVTVCRGLLISVTPVCINDVPYVYYKVEPNFNASAVNPVTLTWVNGDHSVVAAQPVSYGIPLEGRILWPGAVVDSLGNGLDWPGWYIQNGVWVQGADGFEGTRPNAYLRISVNPTDSILFAYPPATPACNANPVSRPPIAVNDVDSSGQCTPIIVNVLANDHDPEGGVLTVSLPAVTSAHGAGLVVNASGTVTYTPPSGFTGTDTFDYIITDPQGLKDTATVSIKINAMPNIVGGILGTCALPKDTVSIYSVSPVANATHYIWTLPSGWVGSSLTNTISVKSGSANGTITVTPYNGGCAGTTVSYNVSIIDFAKVTIDAAPNPVKGDNVSTSLITITLYDPNGNPIHCSGGTATLCTNSGTFTDVVDNGDGTYTGYLRSSANSAIVCGTVGGVKIQQTVTTVFTGPQGSIKGNGPIFETETPLLTFNFTAGIGPFTVIYRAAGSTKNDTLNNVTSNVAIPVKSISATKLYTMVSIIGSDNARRDNNFTRDTATIVVVAPRIVITLTADNPVHLADNLYSTVLRMKVKNNGDINLASVQVSADLKDVFPNPVQFILDSVKQNGRQTVPNNNYDGRSNLDLFSWNSRPGMRNNSLYNTIASAKVPAMTYGEMGGNAGSSMTDGEAGTERVPFLPGNNTEKGNETGGTSYDGPMTTPFFWGALSKLDVGEESSMDLYVRIVPNGYFKPFVMQAVAVGTGHTEFGTALANSLSNDDGNAALHPENTHNGDPLPTVINIFPNAVLGVAMSAGTPVLQGNGTYNVTLNYVLKNYGNVNLRAVSVLENLLRSIGTPATFNVISAPVATGNLVANPSFDGKIDTNMLSSVSTLGVDQSGTISYTINITPNQLSALYRLQATGTGFNIELSTTITDLSTNGTNPDPDGNGIPEEKLITIIPINMAIPPLVPGTIGIQDTPTTTVLTKTYCAASTVTVIPTSVNTGGIDAYTYQWQSSADNVTFLNIAGATSASYTGNLSASTYLRRTVISGDQEAFSNVVRVIVSNVIAKPTITASGSLNLTQSGSITLTSSAASSYLWSTNATTSSIVVSTAGGYSVTIRDANGCTATSDVVAVNPPPPTTVNRTYVIGATTNPVNSGVQVTGLTGATLRYYIVSTGGALIPVPVLPGVIGTYTYYVSQVVNGYESVLVPYTVTMIAPQLVADIQKITSTAPQLQSDGTFLVTFTIRSKNLTAVQMDSVKIKDDLTAVFPSSTKFEVAGVKVSGKLIANELYNGNSQIELLADGSVLPANQTDSIMLTVKVTPNGFAGLLKNTAIQVAKTQYGTITTSSNDPLLSTGVTVRAPTEFVIPAVDIFIPSGFSPNRDGVNDYFVITRPYNTSINLEIYNRWGNLVYRSAEYQNQWDGRGNQPHNVLGEPLPDGTYYYIVTATDRTTGAVRKFAAFLTLKR